MIVSKVACSQLCSPFCKNSKVAQSSNSVTSHNNLRIGVRHKAAKLNKRHSVKCRVLFVLTKTIGGDIIMAKEDRNGDLHSEENGQYVEKGNSDTKNSELEKAKRIYDSDYDKKSDETPLEYKSFEKLEDINGFFLYDDHRRGLLFKRSSLHGVWDHNLTGHQRYVINEYTSDGYSNINSYLRNYDNGENFSVDYVRGQIKALDKAIADYTLREPIITYRSINSEAIIPFDGNIDSIIGTEYTDKAFMSTTPYPNSSALNKNLIMEIKLPAGKGIGAYIDEYNGMKEVEFLLARDSKFIITNVKEEKGHYTVEMELIK